MEKIKQLIDKSVRRSENIINIRGIVMDETSEFDSQMQDIILASQSLMSPEEIHCVKTYVSTNLLKKKINDAGELSKGSLMVGIGIFQICYGNTNLLL